MEIVGQFFIKNFVLICLCIVMVFNAILHYSTSRRIALCTIGITVCCLLLAISAAAQEQAKQTGQYYVALTLAIFGYVVRPSCLYFFVLMNKKAYRGKWSFLILLPLILNVFVYLAAYIPGTAETIFGFEVTASGKLSFIGGPLRFSSHIIAFGYLCYLVCLSALSLRSKHIMHGITIFACAILTTAAVVVESFFNPDGTVEVLNATIMVSTLTYYLFLYKETVQIDGLSNLFNRDAYYRDYPKLSRSAMGVIQFDVNGLKHLNDNFGHEEGDRCISTIGSLINKSMSRSMYGYRMGGDEFLVVAIKASEESLAKMTEEFREGLAKTDYHCSLGYAAKGNADLSLDELIKEAEKKMYAEKSEFYKNAPFERRKV